MSCNITRKENEEILARLFAAIKEWDDGKCCCAPSNRCKGFKKRRLSIRTTEIYCRENEYRCMVIYSLYVFIILIVFLMIYMLNVEEK